MKELKKRIRELELALHEINNCGCTCEKVEMIVDDAIYGVEDVQDGMCVDAHGKPKGWQLGLKAQKRLLEGE